MSTSLAALRLVGANRREGLAVPESATGAAENKFATSKWGANGAHEPTGSSG